MWIVLECNHCITALNFTSLKNQPAWPSSVHSLSLSMPRLLVRSNKAGESLSTVASTQLTFLCDSCGAGGHGSGVSQCCCSLALGLHATQVWYSPCLFLVQGFGNHSALLHQHSWCASPTLVGQDMAAVSVSAAVLWHMVCMPHKSDTAPACLLQQGWAITQHCCINTADVRLLSLWDWGDMALGSVSAAASWHSACV